MNIKSPALLALFCAPLAHADLFINEIHYDNAGGDTGEAIEIAGPAGTDLSGWSLVLYNGNNGAVYKTESLAGIIAEQQGGMGTVSFNIAGIQNGAPDGIALFNGTEVIQFISYEGSFTAVGGVANGMTSTDIGVSESSGTAVGESLQLSGTGSVYSDFTWNEAAANTFGNVNTDQTFGDGDTPPPPPPNADLFINEIHYDNAGGDTGEAIEIAGPAGTDLSGWSLLLYNGSNGTVYKTESLAGIIAEQQGGMGTVSFNIAGIQNGAPDGIALFNGTEVIQFISYEGSFTAVGGVADGMTSTDIGVSESSGTAVGESLQLSGTGSVYSDFTWNEAAANTFGNVNTDQTFGDGEGALEPNALMITEIMQNPSFVSDSAGEWFEVLNVSTQVVNLNGWTIRDDGSDSFLVDQDVLIGIGEYAVIGNNGDTGTNGGVVQVYSYGSQMFLANSSDELILEDPDGNIVDEITYDNGATFPDPNGASMTLVDLYGDNNVGSKWAEDTTNHFNPDSPDTGTPGTGDANFSLVITEIMQNPSAVSDGNGEYFEVLNTGVIAANMNGWTIRDNDVDSHTIEDDVYVPAGTYAVFTNNSDSATNGGFLALYQFSDVFIGNGSDEIVLQRPDGTIEDFVEYDNGATFPDPNGASMTLTSAALDNNAGANWFEEGVETYGDGDFGTPGSGPDGKTFGGGGDDGGDDDVVIGVCTDPATLISAIQGAGDASPLNSETVVVEALVSASYPGLNGFYLQEQAFDYDADDNTSEGLFISYSNEGGLPAVGSTIRVLGTVNENFGRTQLNVSDMLLACEVEPTMVPAIPFSLPFASVEQAEAMEGMLVFNQNDLTVTDNFNLGRFGEVALSSERLFIPTNQHAPLSPEAIDQAATNALNKVVMDDGLSVQNPEPVVYPTGGLSASNTLRSGDMVTSIIGPLDYAFSSYRIHPIQPPTIAAANARQPSPAITRGNITVASLNVLNLFNGDGQGGGFPTSRGADTPFELERQFVKTVAAIAEMDADIIGLMEIENDGFDSLSTIAELTDRLNAVTAEGTYAYVSSDGPIGTDAIAVGLLYKPASVSLEGDVQLNLDAIFNRPPMAQTFAAQNGAEITVVVNHFKSKGCGGATGDDTDQLDGQGCYNAKRTAQSQTLAAWLATNPMLSDKDNVIIMGDLNAYAKEDPIVALENEGFVNLISTYQGEDAYSYTFGGELGYLDHALASASLLEQTVDAIEWHINADEPRILDYNVEFKSEAQVIDFYAPDVFRMSDHDPVMISFDLTPPNVFGDLDGDLDVDYADMRALILLIRARDTSVDLHDINDDGLVNTRDVSALRRLCTRSRCAM